VTDSSGKEQGYIFLGAGLQLSRRQVRVRAFAARPAVVGAGLAEIDLLKGDLAHVVLALERVEEVDEAVRGEGRVHRHALHDLKRPALRPDQELSDGREGYEERG
jgi:hypothetical protein